MDWEEALIDRASDLKYTIRSAFEDLSKKLNMKDEEIARLRAEIARLRDAWPEPVRTGGVWYCEHKHKCKWQGFALHQGLSWGTIPEEHNEWRKWHDIECGGQLIQLVPMPPAPKEG